MKPSFGQRLKAARVMTGLSMDQLVQKMQSKVSKQAISKYENGLMSPDSKVLIELCKALNVPPDFFYVEAELELTGINFRKKSSLGARSIASLTEKVKDMLQRYLEVEAFLEPVLRHKNPLSGTIICSEDDIETAAAQLRSRWGVGSSSPIAHVIALLEEHEVKVIEVSGIDGFDGLSGWADGCTFIVLKADSSTDRKRLTALHEFSHLTLQFADEIGSRDRERLCHSFAASVLLPREVAIRELGAKRAEISLFELRSIKQEYGLSMQAIAHRAFRLGIISKYVLEHLSIEFSRRGWRKSEPSPLPTQEHPFRFEQLIHRAIAEEMISISKGAYLAGKSIEDLRREIMLDDENSPS